MLEYKLANTENFDVSEIKKRLDLGAKFIVFRYQISFIAISFERYSSVYLILDKIEIKKLKNKYNLITLFLGPWSFPWGPLESYSAIKTNNNGGIDVTKDIVLNLDYYDKAKNKIIIKEMHNVFGHISKSDLKEIHKAFLAYLKQTKKIEELYIAQYVNVDKGMNIPFVIGLKTSLDLAEVSKQLEELFYERFYSITELIIFKKEENEELYSKIVEQGQKVKNSIKTHF
ncbi:hypothetical protein [Aureispira anguillae]|uniref:Uncharacterized protein n=1 Tax=Aureispira anguillae TaxID=2864201 RepID=A0A915YDA5_9BACT|nr:hypothetical protein [Aureispira anguillae]BDS10957.1 hypothetical protein AsAng_0016670 [Aureispira anguillae]